MIVTRKELLDWVVMNDNHPKFQQFFFTLLRWQEMELYRERRCYFCRRPVGKGELVHDPDESPVPRWYHRGCREKLERGEIPV